MAKKFLEREFLGSLFITVLVFAAVLTDRMASNEAVIALSLLWGTYNISRGLAKNEDRSDHDR